MVSGDAVIGAGSGGNGVHCFDCDVAHEQVRARGGKERQLGLEQLGARRD